MLAASCLAWLSAEAQSGTNQFWHETIAANRDNFSGVVGGSFKVGDSNVLVSHLGFYLAGSTLQTNHQVGIFLKGGGLLVSANIPAGTPALVLNGYAWVPLTNTFTLTNNTSYILAAQVFNADGDSWPEVNYYSNWNPYFVGTNVFGSGGTTKYYGYWTTIAWPAYPGTPQGASGRAYGAPNMAFLPVVITNQPDNVTNYAGFPVSFAVGVSGGFSPINYQWYGNSNLISGATNATYTTPNLNLTNNGDQYFCVVSNPLNVATSSIATVAVTGVINITLNPNQLGRVFEGIGGVSAGASSRLLIDYPEPQRSQILDYLFKPNYGAALQHLKVEIGGDINSTDGTEPSHQRTATETNFTRGYEWWLMQQAKARNTNIFLDSLAWGAPGWIGGGNYYSQDMCNYIVNFIKGAKSVYNLDLAYTGTHNESGLGTSQTAWIKTLRSTLNSAGLTNVQIVAADEWGGSWNIVTNTTYGLLKDAALSNSISRLGTHGTSAPTAVQNCSQPVWCSEGGVGWQTSWTSAVTAAREYNRNYINSKMTMTGIWCPISSYYDMLPAGGHGLMKANTPWSGYYYVAPTIWATAHTTQFAAPGWTYLEGGASAMLPAGGSMVTLMATNHSDYSVIVETTDATNSQAVTFHLASGLSSGPVYIWQSTPSSLFQMAGTVTPVNGIFNCVFQTNAIYSLTTTTGQSKGNAAPPANTTVPLPFSDNFESYGVAKTPKYFSDQAGAFETCIRADGNGQCLRQVLSQDGLRWTGEWVPYTLLGDSNATDYEVAASVLCESGSGTVFVMGRISAVPGFSSATPDCYWLALNVAANQWELHAGTKLVASGAANVTANIWHVLRLQMIGTLLTCIVDGVKVATISDNTYDNGMAGLGCGGWYGAQFDDFALRPVHDGSFNLALSATATASSTWNSSYSASKANDGSPSTRWNSSTTPATSGWLELDFPVAVAFDRTSYTQYGSAVQGYQVQHWNGSAWVMDVNGGAMGASATDIFPEVTVTKVRLVMTNASPNYFSIYEFGVYDDAPATNSAVSATATASSTWASGSYGASNAVDGDFTTRWSALNFTNNQWLQLDWSSPVSYNRTAFYQYAARINAYSIQHWNGTAWMDDDTNGTPGLNQFDSFPRATASRMRLLMTTNANVPTIWEFQVFNDPTPSVPVTINEWMINNTHTIIDPAGGYQSWFELYNSGATSVNLAGYFLGGTPAGLFQFQIPAGFSIPAGGYLLVWADGQTIYNSSLTDLHVNFILPQSSIISLLDPSGRMVDVVNLTTQAPDTASGSRDDGDMTILTLTNATPRQSNTQIWVSQATRRASDGAMQLQFNGLPFATHRVQASINLATGFWTNLVSASANGLGNFNFTDTNAFHFSSRFYRAVTP